VDYKPNSNRYKEAQKAAAEEEVQREPKVISGVAKTRKKSEIRKWTDVFLAEDIPQVKEYVIKDVLGPAIRKGIWDIITGGLDLILFGGTGRGGGRTTSGGSKISYRNYYDQKDDRGPSARARNRIDYDDIEFESRGDAEVVLEKMDAMLERYNEVSLAAMYESAGLTCPYTYNKYGWRNLRNAEVIRGRDGMYIIKLPPAGPLD
jgi:hypothetical protein